MAHAPRLVLDCKGSLLEGPLWAPETGRLWFLDLLDPALFSFDPRSGAHERIPLGGPAPLSCLARTPGGAFLLARKEGVFLLDPAGGEARPRRVFAPFAEDAGFPDGMTVDAAGCLWVAHWGGGRITRYDPEGTV